MRHTALVLGMLLVVVGAPAALPDAAPDLAPLLWIGPAAAEECAGVDPGSVSVGVNPEECVP